MIEKFFALWKNQTFIELGLAVGLFAVALAIRLPYLMQVPYYTDEGPSEVLWAFDIAQGKHFPLSAVDAYDGPFFAYLIAFAFRMFGTSAELPRLIVAVFGAGTVVLVYALGRVMRDRLTGLIAAALALTAPILIVMQSHQGWSSSLTPFFASLTALALYLGVTRASNRWLAASGLSAAITLQTHPTSAALLLGMAIWFFLQPNLGTRLHQPGLYAAVALFLLGYAPMIIANARADSPLFETAQQRAYAFAPTLAPAEYFRRLIVLLRSAGYFLGGGMGEPSLVLRAQAIEVQIFWLGALAWAWWRKERLIPLVTLTAFVVLPLFVVGESYRYYFALVPLNEVLLGVALSAIIAAPAAKWLRPNLGRAMQIAVLSLLVLFALNALKTTAEYYRAETAQGRTNQSYFDLARAAQGACGAQFYVEAGELDSPIEKENAIRIALDNFQYLLTVSHCDFQVAPIAALETKFSVHPDAWVVLAQPHIPVSNFFTLRLIATGAMPLGNTFVPLALYRVEPRQ